MGRYRNRINENYESGNDSPDARYDIAYKRVKRIKGFYVHLLVYALVNAFILLSVFNKSMIGDAVFWEWQTWNTVFFWGIGLVAHGLSVFGRDLFFGSDWEERKIQEFMDKDKNKKWE
ncbi:2TM domain-containing protein [Flavobacterium sp. K5-23]|uniref:2TM domain-containing protein n=1 Tax=Flavobacterium sp. K5-23 TaxID=2746225 RepID=UPI00200C3746|nr:2TM domain-containing protein [Flavobacterium sp. K5-23]UQD57410.1 2TM domain-containing protein [Flavobacterium sp. K5-23]